MDRLMKELEQAESKVEERSRELQHACQKLHEQEAITSEHQQVESQLRTEAHRLIDTLSLTVDHISGLHSKIGAPPTSRIYIWQYIR